MRWPLLAATVLACQGQDGAIERHRTVGGGMDPGPAPHGEYGPDAGEMNGGGGEDGGAEPELALESLPARTAELTCRRRLDCCAPGERMGLPDDPAACQQELTELLAPFFDGVARAVAAGRARYDALSAAACLADLQAAQCPEARSWEALLLAARCPIIEPSVPPGEDCRASYECIDGFCQGAGDPARPGRCTSPRLPDGQPCDRADDCASGTCHPTLDVCSPAQPGNLCGS